MKKVKKSNLTITVVGASWSLDFAPFLNENDGKRRGDRAGEKIGQFNPKGVAPRGWACPAEGNSQKGT